jgi:hypothetical protein
MCELVIHFIVLYLIWLIVGIVGVIYWERQVSDIRIKDLWWIFIASHTGFFTFIIG